MPVLNNSNAHTLNCSHFGASVKGKSRSRSNAMSVTERDSSLVTVKEAQALLRRGRARVYEMINKNELKHIRDGRSILIPKKSIEDWIEMKRRQNGR